MRTRGCQIFLYSAKSCFSECFRAEFHTIGPLFVYPRLHRFLDLCNTKRVYFLQIPAAHTSFSVHVWTTFVHAPLHHGCKRIAIVVFWISTIQNLLIFSFPEDFPARSFALFVGFLQYKTAMFSPQLPAVSTLPFFRAQMQMCVYKSGPTVHSCKRVCTVRQLTGDTLG